MINYLKVKNHKGIVDPIPLAELGQINVICGKNNSGKTSLLEAIAESKKRSVGKKVTPESKEFLGRLFEPEAARYSGPQPQESRAWFSRLLNSVENSVIYEDEVPEWDRRFKEHLKSDRYFAQYSSDIFNLTKLLSSFLSHDTNDLKVFLIPSNRELSVRYATASLSNTTASFGEEVLKTLFKLKNSSKHSKEQQQFTAIQEAFKEISDGYGFDVSMNGNEIRVQFANDDRTWIFAEDSGLGFRDLLMILRHVIATDASLILIEEPESHMHPDMQRQLLRFLRKQKDKQFVISTHSNIFLNLTFVDRLWLVRYDSNRILVSDQTSKGHILTSLGYSIADNLVSDLIVLTEGPKDIEVLEVIANKMEFSEKYKFKFWPLGGDIMDQVDLSAITQSQKVVALIDSDPKSGPIRKRFIDSCKRLNVECVQLSRYAIENYYSLAAIKSIYPHEKYPENLVSLKETIPVKDQLGFSVKGMGKAIVERMELKDFEGTDLFEFFKLIQKKATEK